MGKICFDFDGVIHSYTSGYLGDAVIPDPPVPGIKQAIDQLRDAGYQVVVLSTRGATREGREAMQDWFDKWGIAIDGIYSIKPTARCYVDDRAVCFDGDASKLFDIIDNFEPWWKTQPMPELPTEPEPAPEYLMGAIVGDIVGSIYEFNNIHTTSFPLFGPGCEITDDTVMTLAVAQALVNAKLDENVSVYNELVDCMRSFGRHYPDKSYGNRFASWLWSDSRSPVNSWGNGAPMRCSPAGWVTDDVHKAELLGIATADPTHNHVYARNAAATVAGMICEARNGTTKEYLRKYAEDKGYDIPTMDWLMDNYTYTESSQGTMPAALACFLYSDSFEDSIRKAVSIGGDSDTIAAITGSIAEPYYGIPDDIRNRAWGYVPERLRRTVRAFGEAFDLE